MVVQVLCATLHQNQQSRTCRLAVLLCSGATLGPIVGKLVAEEILTGTRLPILAPFRPERDFSDLSHLY